MIAARSAKFIQAFCKLGLVPDSGGTWQLPRLVGMARAKGLAMLGDKLSAEQAADWGLIWQVGTMTPCGGPPRIWPGIWPPSPPGVWR